jgi:hypothetical protein
VPALRVNSPCDHAAPARAAACGAGRRCGVRQLRLAGKTGADLLGLTTRSLRPAFDVLVEPPIRSRSRRFSSHAVVGLRCFVTEKCE